MLLSNYLFFTARCEEALHFYERCGIGSAVELWRFGDNGLPIRTESMKGKVMHSKFEGPGVLFYASDNDDAEPMRGSAMIFMLDEKDRTENLFKRLSEEGTITTPLAVQPWGDFYGKLTDKFGVQWMFNCRNTSPQSAK